MNDLPRQTLRRILAKYGKELAGNAQRCHALLNDLCGAYRREINILVTAVEERIPLDLLAAARSMPAELLLTRLEKRLADQTGLTSEAARWAVESWAFALDVVTDSQIAARDDLTENKSIKTRSTEVERQPAQQNASGSNPVSNKPPLQTQTGQTPTKPAATKQPPPVNRQPAKIPFPSSPPVHLPANNQPKIPPVPTNFPPAAKTTARYFRGCLIFIFILIVSFTVLLFGVPFALETMRETQREREREPPRFPVR